MAFLLKELVFLAIVAVVFTFPWKPYEIVHGPSIVQEDFPQPLNDGTGDTVDSAVDESPPDSDKEVYPGETSTKRGTGDTVLDSAVDVHPPDSGEEFYPIQPKRALFYDSNDGDAHFDENKKTRVRRGAVTNRKYLWPVSTEDGKRVVNIPYVSDGSLSWLKTVLDQLAVDTCIKFKESPGKANIVKFTSSGSGCSSDIGYRANKDQTVILGTGCDYTSVISHEIMHLLGFYHEFTRDDRDNFIDVDFGNIQEAAKAEFKVRSQNNLGKPYDLNSVMQYESNAFTKSAGSKTMVAKNNPDKRLGQIAYYDAMDLNKINELYGCDKPTYKDVTVNVKTKDSWLAGTDGAVFVRFVYKNGKKSGWRRISYGGRLVTDENERGSKEEHSEPFPDEGEISKVDLDLEESEKDRPAKKRSIETVRKKKGWFDGWKVDGVDVDGKTFGPSVDLDTGDHKELTKQS